MGKRPSIWLLDLLSGAARQFTLGPWDAYAPLWSGDGRRIIYLSPRQRQGELYLRSASGESQEEQIYNSDNWVIPTDWSADSRWVAFDVFNRRTGWDVWALSMEGDRKAIPVVQTSRNDQFGRFSPNGHWIAYQSDESGRYEIEAEAFPPSNRKWYVSTNGGSNPRWRRDGREIYYLSADRRLMAVPIKMQPTFEAGQAIPLFSVQSNHYDAASDGQRFLVNVPVRDSTPFTLVQNWTVGLKK